MNASAISFMFQRQYKYYLLLMLDQYLNIATLFGHILEQYIKKGNSLCKNIFYYILFSEFKLSSYKARCMLIDFQTFKKRHENAVISFINNVVPHKICSPELLSKLNFFVPPRRLHHREHQLSSYYL